MGHIKCNPGVGDTGAAGIVQVSLLNYPQNSKIPEELQAHYVRLHCGLPASTAAAVAELAFAVPEHHRRAAP